MTQRAAVILAAGKGTRMKSEQPKVLHTIAGKAMVHFPIEAASRLGIERTVLVVGHGAEAVRQETGDCGIAYAVQAEQLGTGHALLCAREALMEFDGALILLAGDVPLIQTDTLEDLVRQHEQAQAAVTVLTMELDNPFGYGRIVREDGAVVRIVEQKDATPSEQALNEVNTGIYCFDARFVFESLGKLGTDNAQGEYYLTDVLEMAVKEGRIVEAALLNCPEEAMGINDRAQLADAAERIRRRLNREHMLAGVTLIDPAQTYIDAGVEIGPDSLIHPGAHLKGKTRIGAGCEIETGVVVQDCLVADRCHLKAGSVLENSEIGAESAVGPMAHLRPGTQLLGENKIGNFVETKKAVIGKGSKASHLTYLGDCELGQRVNVGCGTITCNYDGVNKFRTEIGDDVFVGSDVQLVAPVKVGRGALIAAGATITKDVPEDALAIARAPQKVLEGWAAKRRAEQKK